MFYFFIFTASSWHADDIGGRLIETNAVLQSIAAEETDSTDEMRNCNAACHDRHGQGMGCNGDFALFELK